jgi:hypothetical protein
MSSVNSYLQATTNVKNANRSLAAKIDALRNQPVTAQGAASSVDLMKEYSGNKLHVMTYTPTSLFQSALYDKLFYCGYSHPVQGYPDFTSRCWFNFVQCDPVFDDSSVYSKYLDDIKERFRIGVTVYHYHPNLTDTGYDWDQTYENWETAMVPGVDVGYTNVSGYYKQGSPSGVDMIIETTADASQFNWFVDVDTPLTWTGDAHTMTKHYDYYPGPLEVVAQYKNDITKTSATEIDW